MAALATNEKSERLHTPSAIETALQHTRAHFHTLRSAFMYYFNKTQWFLRASKLDLCLRRMWLLLSDKDYIWSFDMMQSMSATSYPEFAFITFSNSCKSVYLCKYYYFAAQALWSTTLLPLCECLWWICSECVKHRSWIFQASTQVWRLNSSDSV